jgi:hypothetical protein
LLLRSRKTNRHGYPLQIVLAAYVARWARQCTRCGDIDKDRRRRAVAKLCLVVSLAAIFIVALSMSWGQ